MSMDARRHAEDTFHHPMSEEQFRQRNDALWSQVHHNAHVVSADGERLGRVEEKSDYMFTTSGHKDALTNEELYVPHIAVDHVDGDTVHLKWTRQQIADTHDHYRRYHFSQR